MKALIQKLNNEIATTNCHSAFIGFRERGYEISFFETNKFDECEIDRNTVVVGGTPIIIKAFSRLNIPFPSLSSIPDSLAEFAKRKIWQSNLKEVRELINSGKSVFLKPDSENLKQFHGHVACNFADLAKTAKFPENTPVICSEVLDMISEYRVYVTKNEVVGCKHYWGNFRCFPDFTFIDESISKFSKAPKGYAIDFAVLNNGETALIEVNDGFALGSYGLQPMLYSALLEARWQEIMSYSS